MCFSPTYFIFCSKKKREQEKAAEDQSVGSSSVEDKENDELESLPLYESDDSLDLLNDDDDDDDLGFDFWIT